MKKAGTLVLAMVFLLQVGGYYLYVALQEIKFHQTFFENQENYSDEEITLLNLTSAEFNSALVDDHELRIDGKMYDIIRVEQVGDCLMVYAWLDHEEGELLELLSHIFHDDQEESQKGELSNSISQLLCLNFTFPENLIPEPQQLSPIPPDLYSVNHISFISELESPPPQI